MTSTMEDQKMYEGYSGSPQTSNGRLEAVHNVPPASRERYSLSWLQILGGFCLNFNSWGLLGSFGVYQSYYSLEMLQGIPDSKISWIGSVQGFFMFMVSFLIGPIFDAGYLRPLLITGTLFSVLGVFLTSLCTRYWQLFLAQGIATGIGCGCLYLPAPALISMHFKDNQALAQALGSSGTGIGAVIIPAVFTHLEPSIGFAWATRSIGFIVLATSVLPMIVMRYPEHSRPSAAPGTPPYSGPPRRNNFLKLPMRWMPLLVDKDALRDLPLVLVVVGLMFSFMGIYVMLYYINLLAEQRTNTPHRLAEQTLTILNGASTVGRILPSVLADRIGAVHVLIMTSCISGVLAFSSYTLGHSVGLIIWSVAFGTFAGAFMALPAAGIVSVGRSRSNIGTKLGMTLGAVGCGVLLAEPVAGAILGAQGNGWLGFVAWSGSLMMAGCLSLLFARFRRIGIVVAVKI
ncbi:MFS general substrate transporter [Karstenula rhodostoma CBS 690.94]|uniref:MFS general substrate transporter n=1 Tax=Karstenula rhodostoma CBS 690.94 TaxID=1392251 RepID=A0A9P4P6M5_9PLEO|nr:MFS general substrate transporter [Karstenula rhodostoma CBS 690.94]